MAKEKAPSVKRPFIDRYLDSNGMISVSVVLLGFLVGTILVALVGKNPANMYKAIIQAITGYNMDNGRMNVRYIGESLNYAVPFVLCGLCLGFAYRAGLFNVGGEGQYVMGMTFAQIVGLLGPQVPFLHWVLAMLAAIIVGAIWGGVVGFLKAKFEVSEVVGTIMLNYIALYLSRLITFTMPGATTYRTADFPETALMENAFFERITNNSSLNNGFILMFIALFVYWFIMEKTSLGYSLRATGFNKDAARCSGIPVVRSITTSMALAGAFAGLAGGIVALGGAFSYGRILAGQDNYGFNGMAVALIGNCRALGTLLAGLLFGVLKNAQALMQGKNIPKEITFIIQGLIVVFIAFRSALDIVKANRAKSLLKKEVLK